MAKLGATELTQDRLERMFAYYNANWPAYYGTEKVFYGGIGRNKLPNKKHTHPEYQYLDLLQDIMATGWEKHEFNSGIALKKCLWPDDAL